MTKNKVSDDDVKLALIEIQHRLQKPMSASDMEEELQGTFSGDDETLVVTNVAKRVDELYRDGIFVAGPRKVRDAWNKLTIVYGLPQYVPEGVTFENRTSAERTARLTTLAGLLASTQLSCLESHIRKQGLKIGEDLIGVEMLKINFQELKRINLQTLERLAKDYRGAVDKSVAETISDEAINQEQSQ